MKIRILRIAGMAFICAILILNYSFIFADVRTNPDIVYDLNNNRYLVTYPQAATFDSIPSIRGSIRDPDGTYAPGIPEFNIGGPTILPEKAAAAYDFENSRYLVVWANYGTGPRLYGRFVGADGIVDPAGVPGGPFPIGRELSGNSVGQTDPSVAFSSTSNSFFVVWADAPTETTSDIYGQIVNDDGNFPGGSLANFPISEQSGDESVPVVAHDSANNVYLVVWEDSGTGGPNNSGIYGQVVNADGTFEGESLTITSTSTPDSSINNPSITYDSLNENFFVVWDSWVSSLGTGRIERIDGRLIKVSSEIITDGFVPIGAEGTFIIYGANALTNIRIAPVNMDAQNTSVASSSSGNYLVVWEDGRNVSTADFAPDIYGQRVNADGTLNDVNFSVYTAIYDQRHPSVAFNSEDNNFAVAFEDYTSAGSGEQDIQIVLVSSDSADLDTAPPILELITPPIDGATNVPVDTNVVINVRDSGTGVDQSTIVLTVNGAIVTPAITGDQSNFTLTYDPLDNFDNDQLVTVEVSASDLAGNSIPDSSNSFSFLTADAPGDPWDSTDADGDDIPNSEEEILGSDPNKKTLFVRAKVFALGDEYWTDEFMDLFPPPSGAANGRAYIDAFAEAGIEVMVIGADDHPHIPMQDPNWDEASDPTDFDPETDGIQPPHVNIMEVWKYNTFNAGSPAQGHIGFYDDFLIPDPDNPGDWIAVPQWRWDTKGLTPRPAGADPAVYLSPRVYIDPLDDYFTEGAYTSMAAGATTPVTTCTDAACDMVTINPTHLSPMNLNDTNHTLPPAPTSSDDGTVEVNNDIFFCAGTESHDVYGDGSLIYNCTAAGEIYHVAAAPRGDGYVYDDVWRRTLIHEMGHGLHFDHCTNPYCIMWMFVDNWELYDGSSQTRYGFGTTGPAGESCTHATEIRADGTIHNSISP